MQTPEETAEKPEADLGGESPTPEESVTTDTPESVPEPKDDGAAPEDSQPHEPDWKNEAYKHMRLTEKLTKQVEALEGKLSGIGDVKEPETKGLSPEERRKQLEEHYKMPYEDIERVAKLAQDITKKDRDNFMQLTSKLKRSENWLKIANDPEFWDYAELKGDVDKEMDKLGTDLQSQPEVLKSVYWQVRGRNMKRAIERTQQDAMRKAMEDKNVVNSGLRSPSKGSPGNADKRNVAPTTKQTEFARRLGLSPESLARASKKIKDEGGRFPPKRKI